MKFIKGQRVSIKTEFKKGMTPWNKGKPHLVKDKHPMWGKHHSEEALTKIREARAKQKMKSGEDATNWKGDKVGYRGLHGWLCREFGRASKCEDCGILNAKRYDWANKSGKYKRDRSDWEELCRKCHIKKDDNTNKAWVTKRKKCLS